jgi:hypothetical protein
MGILIYFTEIMFDTVQLKNEEELKIIWDCNKNWKQMWHSRRLINKI